LQKFQEGLKKGVIIHGIDIIQWALKARKYKRYRIYSPSPQWVRKFKRLHRIPQKITKFMTETIQSKEQKQKVRDLSRM